MRRGEGTVDLAKKKKKKRKEKREKEGEKKVRVNLVVQGPFVPTTKELQQMKKKPQGPKENTDMQVKVYSLAYPPLSSLLFFVSFYCNG